MGKKLHLIPRGRKLLRYSIFYWIVFTLSVLVFTVVATILSYYEIFSITWIFASAIIISMAFLIGSYILGFDYFTGSNNISLEFVKNKGMNQEELFVAPSFLSDEEEIDRKRVFVIMPFTENWSNDVYKEIKTTGEKLSLNIFRADEIFSTNDIMDEIWQSIEKADLIIADITEHNANVFYELGIAHALEKKVMLIRNKKGGERIPFDISKWRYIEYELTPKKTEEFKENLSKAYKEFVSKNNIS
jgi:nucleoside 2-deoxyribosyltransferase